TPERTNEDTGTLTTRTEHTFQCQVTVMINKSITEKNKKRPIIGRLICRNNQKQIPLASEIKNQMEKGTILIEDDNKGVLASLELLLET
ncbi:hypothetical protein NE700_21430, partial [Phocaeicola vulgatus]|nr:hypothetical protein [Phocaeicola vulgatus]